MSSGASTSDPVAKALASARGLVGMLRTKFGAMSKPARVMLVTTVAAALLITSYVGYRSSETNWTTLYSNLDREDASAVVSKLKEMKVPYRVEGEGGTIEVPQHNVRELRLELAGAGLPRGGGVGFESFDKLRLGATEFEQRVLYRRSLEGELSRTIDTIAAVQSSRVHLVLPERSVFVGRAEPSTASVVLKLRPGRTLGSGEVAGIVHLVSSSVASLTPERVAVVTTEGTVLHKPRREGEANGIGGALADDDQVAAARSLEATLEERARSMLEKVLGPGHVDVRVAAELDHSRIERVEDRYDPKQQVLRSEQASFERSGTDVSATGVPGTESNMPEAANRADGGAPTAAREGNVRESHTRNFEIDHIVEKRLLVSGGIRRLTVAVVVDEKGKDGVVRPREEVERLGALVRSAVGADDKRGDLVTVEAVPFLEPEPAPVVVPKPFLPFNIPEPLKKYIPHAIGGAGAFFVLSCVILILRARKRARIAALNVAPTVNATALVLPSKEEELALAGPAIEELLPEELRTRAHERAAEDPATAALVLRFWLGEGNDRTEPATHSLTSGTRVA